MFEKHRYWAFAILAFFVTFVPLCAASEQESKDTDVILNLKITDEKGEPIEGAKAQVMKWTGSYEPTAALAEMNADGQATLRLPFSDDYYYLKFQADGYATSVRGLPQISEGMHESLELRLSRPVQSWVQVSANGKALEGAELSSLEFVDVNDSVVYLTFKTGPQVGMAMSASDEKGRLLLPQLPLGAKVSLTITHPEWKSFKFEELLAQTGALGDAELQPGLPVVVKLACSDPATLADLEGKRATVNMFPPSGGSRHSATVRHAFPIVDGEVRLTAHAAEYAELRFSLDDYFTFPLLVNHAYSPNPELDLKGRESAEFELQVFRKQKARGRVVDHNGQGISGAYVSASVRLSEEVRAASSAKENEPVTPNSSNPIFDFINKSISAGDATTDDDGYYEIEAAPGRVQIEVIHTGVFASPLISEYDWSGDYEQPLPEIVMLPIPKLKGTVVDGNGKPVIGSIVTLQHYGRGDADPVGTSSADGSFELNMSRIPYSYSDTELETNVYVLAMDPNSGRAGIQRIDLTDPKATTGIQVEIAEKSADWPLKALGEPPEALKEINASFAEDIQELRKEFALGMKGNLPPPMHEGTWLNSDATSLKDFRGKYVLLDFWFIGCGPCMRDLPSVKVAHQEFSRYGFSVVSVNVTGQKVDDVEKFARSNGMNYPIVVDGVDGVIMDAYRKLGVVGFPSYILLGPDGRILHNDQLTVGKSLRQDKLELIYQAVRSGMEK